MGGGFALGTQEVQYFVRFGSSAFYFPIITMGILATVFYFAWEFQRLYHVTDYVSFFRTLFAPAGSLFMTLYDIAFSITVVLAAGATLAGFGEAVLIGDRKQIDQALTSYSDTSFVKDILEAGSEEEKARIAVETVKQGGVLLKGTTKTSVLMKAALNKEWGLRTGATMTSVAAYEDERDGNKKLVLMSDGGIVVAPDLNMLVAIINNAVEVAHKLGNPKPKVAVLCAVEVVNPDMPETINAAILAKMSERGQIKGCIVDGPLALDNAVSKYAAEKKGIKSPVAGDADILICPGIAAGNILGKSIEYYAHRSLAVVIVGARAPIMVPSRSDRAETKLYSIALTILCSMQQ